MCVQGMEITFKTKLLGSMIHVLAVTTFLISLKLNLLFFKLYGSSTPLSSLLRRRDGICRNEFGEGSEKEMRHYNALLMLLCINNNTRT